MNTEIDNYTKDLWQNAVDIFDGLEKIKMTLVNIKISVAKMDNSEEARVMNAIASYIENSIDSIEEKTQFIRNISKEIGVINRSTEKEQS
ncbi:hypothetical protein CACET_c21180 [Clostridium aceticum]|uniref:Uncharacterized protein n=1 Tax=Clostridium aceticum TaxID=84022 RepID=A0A0D8ICD7_9CLOT|nr:hypothetical protein [Clostridium aceticum]AKL95565.1 hypothetical protein CACET_c21180 [Clostridium aceticum]KJF26856.1 hypothetical protein TZ02_11675 [Clostridium aceticum]